MLRAPGDVRQAVARLGGYPVVLKFIRGSQGVGVIYAPDESVVLSVLEALNLVQYDVLLQRFYPQAARTRPARAGAGRRAALGRAAHQPQRALPQQLPSRGQAHAWRWSRRRRSWRSAPRRGLRAGPGGGGPDRRPATGCW